MVKLMPCRSAEETHAAAAELLRRLVTEAQAWGIEIGKPIRQPRTKLVREIDLKKAVKLALMQQDCSAVLILFDGDADCPAELGPTVQDWATVEARETPCEVVIAHREYEAWFLAAIESLQGYRAHSRNDAAVQLTPGNPHANPGTKSQRERPIGSLCCEESQRWNPERSTYLETTDQPALSAKGYGPFR